MTSTPCPFYMRVPHPDRAASELIAKKQPPGTSVWSPPTEGVEGRRGSEWGGVSATTVGHRLLSS